MTNLIVPLQHEISELVPSSQYVIVSVADCFHNSANTCFLTVTVNKEVRNYVQSATVPAYSVTSVQLSRSP